MDSKDKMVMAPPACDPRWYVSLGGSLDYQLGEFSEGIDEVIGGFADLHIQQRDYDDVFNNWWNVQGEVGYVLTNHIELFGTFRYTHGDSEIVTGSFLDFGQIAFNFVSQYSDYDSFGGELGLRYFFTDKESRIRPYVSVSAGATFVDSIGLHADSDFLGTVFNVYDGPFYDDSICGTAAALVGIEFQVIPCKFSIGIDAGVRWQSELEDDDNGFADFAANVAQAAVVRGANAANLNINGGSAAFQSQLAEALSHINNGDESHFTIPVTVYAKFRF